MLARFVVGGIVAAILLESPIQLLFEIRQIPFQRVPVDIQRLDFRA
jgi:hypothetical protein